MFVAAKQENGFRGTTRALNAPRYKCLQRDGWGNKMARNHPKHEF